MPKPADLVTVKPSPDLPPMSYVRGVPADGIALPADEAERLVAAGLVVIVKPDQTYVVGEKGPELFVPGTVPEKETD